MTESMEETNSSSSRSSNSNSSYSSSSGDDDFAVAAVVQSTAAVILRFHSLVRNASVREEDLDGNSDAVNNTIVPMASKLVKPIGNKEFKRMEKVDKSIATLISRQQDIITKLAVSSKHIAHEKYRLRRRQIKLKNLWRKVQVL
jgi:hypothetical protein